MFWKSPDRSQSDASIMRSFIFDIALAAILVVAGVLLRIACSELPNFAPVAAIGLFAGFCLSRKLIAVLVPIAIMVVSNFWFGGYDWPIMLSVLACYAAMPFAGSLLKFDRSKAAKKSAISCRLGLYATSFAGSILFFVVTNFAVWATHSQHSIWDCYAAAVPFFRYTALSDIVFAFTFFASYDLVKMAMFARSPERQHSVEKALDVLVS